MSKKTKPVKKASNKKLIEKKKSEAYDLLQDIASMTRQIKNLQQILLGLENEVFELEKQEK